MGLQTFSKFSSNQILTTFKFILIIAGTVLTGYITNYVILVSKRPIEVVVVYVMIILLSILTALILLYTRDQNVQYKKIKYYDSLIKDIILLYYHKKIFFDDDYLRNNESKVIIYKAVQNNMGLTYNSLKHVTVSKTALPNQDKIKWFKDGDPIEIPEENFVYTDIVKKRNSEKSEELEIQIPLNLEDQNICKIKCEYPTSAFKKAKEKDGDYVSIVIDHITKNLKFEIVLLQHMRLCYKFVPMDDNTKVFEILDNNFERMWNSEEELRKNQNKPNFSESKISWVINTPKLGYRYKLYFKIAQKTEVEINQFVNQLQYKLCPPIITDKK
jgi:hypothetical protein